MELKLFALRAATSASDNPNSIIENVCNLYVQLLEKNKINEADIVALQIGITSDLTAINPAAALRSKNLAIKVPLFCTQEPAYKNSATGIIRFLLFFYGKENHQLQNLYLNGAANLRSSMEFFAQEAVISSNYKNLSDEKQNLVEHVSDTGLRKLWLVSREYAGISEAGGLKNVVKALAENSSLLGVSVTVFLPKYFNTKTSAQKVFSDNIYFNQKNYELEFLETKKNNIKFVFVDHKIFNTKSGIYTYTEEEAKNSDNPKVQKGCAYLDIDEMNLLFQFAILAYAKNTALKNLPNVIHCHDAHTAFLPALFQNDPELSFYFKRIKFFVTIHNAGDAYRQQLWGLDYAKKLTGIPQPVLETGLVDGGVEPFLVCANFAVLTTVSPWYANELHDTMTSPFSYNFSEAIFEKQIPIIGITNGIEYKNYNPTNTEFSLLPFSYRPFENEFEGKYKCREFFLEKIKDAKTKDDFFSGLSCYGNFNQSEADKKFLYFVYHGRIVHQKGIDILLKTVEKICKQNLKCRFLIMGQGNHSYENKCIEVAKKFYGKLIYLKGYSKKIARLVTAISDFIILPSLFEPCGLEDFIAQIYATIPIAHAVGGLNKIENNKTGFLFSLENEQNKYSMEKISEKIEKIIFRLTENFINSTDKYLLDSAQMQSIVLNANKRIKKSYNWKKIVKEKYFSLYGFS